MKKFKVLETKRQFMINKCIVGIDPGKKTHQAVILDQQGMRCGHPISFSNNRRVYDNFIAKVYQQSQESNAKDLVQQRNRIHSLLARIFPEFCQLLHLEKNGSLAVKPLPVSAGVCAEGHIARRSIPDCLFSLIEQDPCALETGFCTQNDGKKGGFLKKSILAVAADLISPENPVENAPDILTGTYVSTDLFH